MIAPAIATASYARRHARERASMRAFLLFAVVPNLVLRACEFALRGTATLVNLEILAIAIVAPTLGVPLTIAALVLTTICDITTFTAPVFHFETAGVIPGLAELAVARPGLLAALTLVVLVVLTLVMWGLVRAGQPSALRDWRVRLTLVGLTAALIGADAANGSGNAIATRRALFPVNVAGAPTLQLALATVGAWRDARRPVRPVTPATSATSRLFRDLGAAATPGARTQIALVLVESMGRLRDERADSALFAALLDSAVARRYEIRRGMVPFDGPTTAGEFRELCGQRRTYRNAPRAPLAVCLPARLKKQGYTTVALHAFRRSMFDRARWYPLIGFDSIIDDAVLRRSGKLPECGTIFRGPCDAAVAPRFSALLHGPDDQPRFVYWLTLSAHFPADARAAEGSLFKCEVWQPLADENNACMLARIWSRDLASIREVAMSAGLAPTRFVIVGDHAPPLPEASRARLFADGIVPFVELVPRTASFAPPARTP